MAKQKNREMEVVFLGTGTSQGVPVIGCDCPVCRSADPRDNRLRSALLVRTGQQNIVIDAGPDFRQQMLREQVRTLRAILITHEHVDHIFGLDDIRSFNWIQKQPVDIRAEARVQDAIRRTFDYVFTPNAYPGVPRMKLHPIDGTPFEIDDIPVVPVRCYHHKLPVYGFRIGPLGYITDASHIPEEELKKLSGIRVLIINALRVEEHRSHFNLKQALAVIRQVSPEQAFLTHISHRFGTHEEIQAMLPPGVFPGFDGLHLKMQFE